MKRLAIFIMLLLAGLATAETETGEAECHNFLVEIDFPIVRDIGSLLCWLENFVRDGLISLGLDPYGIMFYGVLAAVLLIGGWWLNSMAETGIFKIFLYVIAGVVILKMLGVL